MRAVVIPLLISLVVPAWLAWASEDSQPMKIGLLKKGELYLREQIRFGTPALPHYAPGFLISRTGNIAVIDEEDDWIYFLDSEGNLIRRVGGKGLEPGMFPNCCYSESLSDRNEIVAADVRRRVNVYDDSGILLRSIFVPEFRLSPDLARKYKNFLIASGYCMDEEERVFVFDLETGKKVSQFCVIEPDEVERLSEKNVVGLMYGPLFDISPQGHLLCTKTYDHRVFEYTVSGELVHVYEQTPPHYVSVFEVEPGPPVEEQMDSQYTWEWEATWTYSGCPSLYGRNMFVVPRRLFPPFYLDFYSIDKKEYLGYCELGDRPFVFSDSTYIYLYEHYSDTLLVVGKYLALVEGMTEDQAGHGSSDSLSWVAAQKLLEESFKETFVELPESVDDLRVVGLDGRERPFREFLTDADYHFVIFVRPFFDCPFTDMYKGIRKFCENNTDLSLYVMISHPYREELELLTRGLELEAAIIPNLNPRLTKNIAPSYPYPGVILLNRDGSKELASYSTYDLYGEDGKPLDQFLKEIESIVTSERNDR